MTLSHFKPNWLVSLHDKTIPYMGMTKHTGRYVLTFWLKHYSTARYIHVILSQNPDWISDLQVSDGCTRRVLDLLIYWPAGIFIWSVPDDLSFNQNFETELPGSVLDIHSRGITTDQQLAKYSIARQCKQNHNVCSLHFWSALP